MKTYTFLVETTYSGIYREAGSEIRLSDAEAKYLLLSGQIAEKVVEKAKAKADD